MIDSYVETKYLLDTNVLIGFSLWKPIALKLNEDFWIQFSEALKNDQWVLLDVVVNEVKYDKDLIKWCKEQKKNSYIKKIADEHRNRAIEINNEYTMIDQTTGKSTVDTYLVAYAEKNSLGIFSRESPRINPSDLYKIPDVCNELGIKRLNKPKAFLRTIGFG